MFDSPILEVIAGMIFIYSLLSILVTQINTVIATVLRLRARHLLEGINELVQDPILRAKVVTHPLIRLVKSDMVLPNQRIDEQQAEQIINAGVHAITWINPKTFTEVLMNLIKVDSDKELFGSLLEIVDGMPAGADRRRLRVIINRLTSSGEGLDELRQTIANLPEAIYREALTEALDDIDEEIGRMGLEPNSIVSLRAGLRNINNIYFRTALETILSTAQNMQEAGDQIQSWFDEQMDRTTTAYKRTMTFWSLLVGFVIAVLLNVDTLNIARTLWEDPALRAQVAAIAATTDLVALNAAAEGNLEAAAIGDSQSAEDVIAEIAERSEAALETVNTLMGLRLPLGWRLESVNTAPPLTIDTNGDGVADAAAADAQLTATQQTLLWDPGNVWNFVPGNSPNWFSLWAGKILGVLATMIAIAQGAPFWFNLLSRLTGGATKGE
ncbi:hypothetical protein G4Y79_11850 [Phototrophicus methaneseepsis]|uniref:Uncharacterized protein n=1 Tax=Phototrophicus methaneseepsis TaxID=2710758 RepID=A0A7S8EDL6_9CHLR|nr:hypothetical protein [Phototrophicus methaneseepsis]QPC85025.1 hypothetical protein G4Y79_11850 [Phototrophicus methaneseepsis]